MVSGRFWCRGRRTVERLNGARLGNAVAMTVYDLRIVKTRGS